VPSIFFHYIACFLDEHLPGRGQLDISVAAYKQRHGQPLLELAHGIADSRRHAVQLLCGTTEATVSGDGIDYVQRVFRPHVFAFKIFDVCRQLLSLHKQMCSWIMHASQQIV
jgi:hypothetical protein